MVGDEFVGAIGLSGAFTGYEDEHCAWRGFVENDYYGPYKVVPGSSQCG